MEMQFSGSGENSFDGIGATFSFTLPLNGPST
jgi:hypothetical protein